MGLKIPIFEERKSKIKLLNTHKSPLWENFQVSIGKLQFPASPIPTLLTNDDGAGCEFQVFRLSLRNKLYATNWSTTDRQK